MIRISIALFCIGWGYVKLYEASSVCQIQLKQCESNHTMTVIMYPEDFL